LERPYLKKVANTKRGWWSGLSGIMEERLPSKCEARNSNSSTTRKKKGRREGRRREKRSL
jgi:hypothetical protein